MSANSSSVPIEHVFIGVMFTGFAFIDLILYLPCLIVIRTNAELKKHSCFQFMFHLGLSDMINIIGQAVCGVWTILGTQIPYKVNKLFGSVMTGAWFGYVTLLHVIAINRYIQVCCKPYYKHLLFSGQAVTGWLAFCWLFAISWGSLMLLPQAGMIYSRSNLCWYFDMGTEWSSEILKVNWLLDIIFLKGSILWYVAIIIRLRFKLTEPSTMAQRRMREKERRILRQAALIGLYPFIWVQYWNVAGWLHAKGFSYAFAVGNLFWISNHAVNPIVYLTMNSQIQRKVKEMLGIKPGNRVVPIAIAMEKF